MQSTPWTPAGLVPATPLARCQQKGRQRCGDHGGRALSRRRRPQCAPGHRLRDYGRPGDRNGQRRGGRSGREPLGACSQLARQRVRRHGPGVGEGARGHRRREQHRGDQCRGCRWHGWPAAPGERRRRRRPAHADGAQCHVGSVYTNKAEATLSDTVPVARLIEEAEAIVVPGSSPYQTLDDLVTAWKADPAASPSVVPRLPAVPTT